MQQVLLNYDPKSGNVTDDGGVYIGCMLGLSYEKVEDKKTVIETNELVKLREAGYTVEEIAHLRDRGIV